MGKTKTAFVSGMTEEPSSAKATEGRTEKPEKTKGPAKEKPEKVHIAGLKGGQRIKTIDVGPIVAEVTEEAAQGAEKKKEKKLKIRGKKYQQMKAKVDSTKLYPLAEAVALVKATSYSKFDGAVELHVNVKKEGLAVKVTLPHAGGKEKKVEVATDATIEKLKEGKIDFDVLLSTAEMMPKLVPFAKILGPRGLMPNPKNETLIKDSKEAKKFSTDAVTLKAQKDFPVIHTVVGKTSQDDKELIQNTQTIIDALGVKLIDKAYLKATMGPSVKLAIS